MASSLERTWLKKTCDIEVVHLQTYLKHKVEVSKYLTWSNLCRYRLQIMMAAALFSEQLALLYQGIQESRSQGLKGTAKASKLLNITFSYCAVWLYRGLVLQVNRLVELFYIALVDYMYDWMCNVFWQQICIFLMFEAILKMCNEIWSKTTIEKTRKVFKLEF